MMNTKYLTLFALLVSTPSLAGYCEIITNKSPLRELIDTKKLSYPWQRALESAEWNRAVYEYYEDENFKAFQDELSKAVTSLGKGLKKSTSVTKTFEKKGLYKVNVIVKDAGLAKHDLSFELLSLNEEAADLVEKDLLHMRLATLSHLYSVVNAGKLDEGYQHLEREILDLRVDFTLSKIGSKDVLLKKFDKNLPNFCEGRDYFKALTLYPAIGTGVVASVAILEYNNLDDSGIPIVAGGMAAGYAFSRTPVYLFGKCLGGWKGLTGRKVVSFKQPYAFTKSPYDGLKELKNSVTPVKDK